MLKSVDRLLNTRFTLNPPTLWVLEALHVWNVVKLYLITSSVYKKTGRHRAPICLVLIVILLWQYMIRNQRIAHSNLSFRSLSMMMWLHYGFTAIKMQIIIWIISTLLMLQVRLNLLCKLKMKMAISSETLDSD